MTSLITAFDITADVLVSLALIASVCIGETFAAGEIAFIMQTGALLEDVTTAKARAGIEKLVHLTPRTARLIKNGIERTVQAEQVWIVIAALAFSVMTWLISGQITRAVTILVVFCPCALVLATPAAIMAAIGNAAGHGFLVREGDALERLAGVSKITFDKTGTLTRGTPRVTAVRSVSDLSETDVYILAAAVEQLSEHPLGKAVHECCRQQVKEEIPACRDFQMLPGKGVSGVINGNEVFAGSAKMMQEYSIGISSDVQADTDSFLQQGSTVIQVAVNGRLAGYLVLSDTMREESSTMIRKLQSLGVQPVLLTGDNENAARTIAGELGIREVYAGCLPEDKLNIIGSCQRRGEIVCMIGDGINDAPALKKADVGIAMGGIGSDIAADAADIVLVDDEVKELPHLLALSKRMMRTIRGNLIFSMTLNFIALALALSGILNPVIGALVHNAGSVLVILNSALLLRWGKET